MPELPQAEIRLIVDAWDWGHRPLTPKEKGAITHAIWAFTRSMDLTALTPTDRTDRIHRLVSLWYLGRYFELHDSGTEIFKR